MSLISNMFKSKKLKSPVDLSLLEVDMHSHILPGIDDGAYDMSSSTQMVQQLAGLGYRKLIATPHIMSDIYKNTPQIIINTKEKLKKELIKKNPETEITAAAEYLLDEGLLEHLEKYDALTMGDNYILLELPYFTEPNNIYEIIFRIHIKGYKIILAHPERYVYWCDDFSKFEKLKDRDVYFQLNISTFAEKHSFPTRKIADNLINLGMVNFLGTDIHNKKQFELLEKALYEPPLAKLVESGNLMNHLL